jgi:hypothetical protein
VELVKAVNEIGVICLPYPEKVSTIGEITAWFNMEIQALLDVIAKANKNFLVYRLVGVLKMLQEHADASIWMGWKILWLHVKLLSWMRCLRIYRSCRTVS